MLKVRHFCTRVSYDTINTQVKIARYAVRGPIVSRSMELAKVLADDKRNNIKTLPFDEIISCNIGNPHHLEQAPLSYIRDVLSLTINPGLSAHSIFPADVVKRAHKYLDGIPSLGAYSESQGIAEVRQDVADFLTERDGYAGNPNNIFLTNGASDGVRLCLQTVLRDPTAAGHYKDGIMTPIPQYPLYSALITLLKGNFVPYYLDESIQWGCTVQTLDESLAKAKKEGISVRGLVVINPGNPTGQVMPKAVMVDIVEWCRKHQICLMADEVYQENLWETAKFTSFRKVAFELNSFQESVNREHPGLQLISFHSISKGFLGECGLRGGYFELLGIPDDVKQELYKLASISLCSNTIGQIAAGLMVRPPIPGDESYETYEREKNHILSSLSRRAKRMRDALNSLEGVSCTNIAGAMYAFPSITLPKKAVEKAKEKGLHADELYCGELLESTGIVVVPGSGFGQREGTYHFRTTILPPEDKLDLVINKLTTFHRSFLERYK